MALRRTEESAPGLTRTARTPWTPWTASTAVSVDVVHPGRGRTLRGAAPARPGGALSAVTLQLG